MQAEANYEVEMQEQWTLFASPETASRIRGVVEGFCSKSTVEHGRVNDIKLAVTEAANNAPAQSESSISVVSVIASSLVTASCSEATKVSRPPSSRFLV